MHWIYSSKLYNHMCHGPKKDWCRLISFLIWPSARYITFLNSGSSSLKIKASYSSFTELLWWFIEIKHPTQHMTKSQTFNKHRSLFLWLSALMIIQIFSKLRVFILYFLVNLLKPFSGMWGPKALEIVFCCSLLCLQHPEKCLPTRRYSMNSQWANEWQIEVIVKWGWIIWYTFNGRDTVCKHIQKIGLYMQPFYKIN